MEQGRKPIKGFDSGEWHNLIDVYEKISLEWTVKAQEKGEGDHRLGMVCLCVCVCVLVRAEGQILVVQMETIDRFKRYLGGPLT